MNRNKIILDRSTHEDTIIAVDSENAEEILTYIFKDKVDTEFKEIRDILKQNIRNREKYCKADVTDSAGNMFEMRFTRNGRNDRIYCQEIRTSKKRYIIMCELFEGKKSQEIPKKIKSRIETMSKYEYNI